MVDLEHFFDGYLANPEYALACAKTAVKSGARWAVLCDTNGGTLPHEIERIVAEVAEVIPGPQLAIHAHNDTGNAVANSLAAIRAGARQVQGTLNGLGERCGNANLVTLIPTLALKSEFSDRFETGVTPEALQEITTVSRAFDELLNRSPNRHAPYVGASAFATKAGIHASALAKDPRTYEHIAARKRRQPARRTRLRPGGPVEPADGTEAARRRGRSGRPAPQPAARFGEDARGPRLCL